MIKENEDLERVLLESKKAISNYTNTSKISLLDNVKIEMGDFDFFEEAAVFDADKNTISIKENSVETPQQLKHIVTHECYHVISTDLEKDITGFMNIDDKEKLRGLNEGYTELLAMSTSPDDGHITYIPQIVMTNLVTKIVSSEVMNDCYFNNKPEKIYQALLGKLKSRRAVDNLLTCLTIELKPKEKSILGTMEFSTMSLLIENNDLSYKEYQDYRDILVGYNKALASSPLLQSKFSTCRDVVKEVDKLYSEKERMRMVNESSTNKIVEGVKKHD